MMSRHRIAVAQFAVCGDIAARVTANSVTDYPDQFVGHPHIAEVAQDVVERGLMLLVASCRVAVGDHDHPISQGAAASLAELSQQRLVRTPVIMTVSIPRSASRSGKGHMPGKKAL